MDKNRKVVEANIQLHTTLANQYNSNEPHFRTENINKVNETIKELSAQFGNSNLLDLGCGTGFIINIAKKYFRHITGVDVTDAMLEKVDTGGPVDIELINSDTALFKSDKEYDMVSAYSFLHHLYDIRPTLVVAYNQLKKGGVLYADLDPNYYFWESISKNLSRDTSYDPIVNRELEMTVFKDEDIEKQFGVDKEVFNHAEYGKNIAGGFKEDAIVSSLKSIGFSEVRYNYHWFLGEGFVINRTQVDRKRSFEDAQIVNEVLQKTLPLSRHLFKYVSFVAIK